jgi:ABC-type dipeptide/oligopeptide/nickel transport system ATPase component
MIRGIRMDSTMLTGDSHGAGTLLRVRGLRTEFAGAKSLVAVEDATFDLRAGEVLGVVGESGSGKSVLVKSLMRILPPNGRVTAGDVHWMGEDLRSASEERMRHLRGHDLSIIFQNPQASLNPARKVGEQLLALVRHRNRCSRDEARRRSLDLLGKVRLADPERVFRLYPFECSGGMCQRILIAMALTGRPKLLIADEPTTSLDVTIQAQIIRLILDLKQELGMAMLFVSHDLAVVASICDRVAVMYRGRIVETAPAAQLFSAPGHPYTKELLESSLVFQPTRVTSPARQAWAGTIGLAR